jgi:hypothetical protein
MPSKKKDKEAFVSVLNYTHRLRNRLFWPAPHKSRLRPERLQTTQAMTGFLRVASTENISPSFVGPEQCENLLRWGPEPHPLSLVIPWKGLCNARAVDPKSTLGSTCMYMQQDTKATVADSHSVG